MPVLSIRQKSSVRHFIYYLVNGTLDFDLVEQTFDGQYHEVLKNEPELFYKTACVFINQETAQNLDWPNVKKLGKFICSLYKQDKELSTFESWETNYVATVPGYSSDFKLFTEWLIKTEVVKGISYKHYISEGASFAEQCFAIWTNVVEFNDNKVSNSEFARERVIRYIKSYYLEGFIDDLEDWEFELHME
ncbi:hypothetical protein I2I05_07370 [Hymenobacter sp. BT683]|uniref:DUF7677 domain-containing protein n=1 Tax=Hymenobacter jeongseonensis TaxID=2791027 RepID=A0ABS0IFR3_9BACT|nr:hypothetical protein [Hymenobacter jeongseonensis]MBF9237213.1 hypothetical protein [Hymenobacter jeongseonensis]